MLIGRGKRVKPNTLAKVIEFVGKATHINVKAKVS